MTEPILFVDDDPQILNAFKRSLRKRFDLHTAEGAAAGLEALSKGTKFSVVISDQQMPEMDGITFLKKVKAQSPLTVRMMLTGNADQKTAMDAVNEGHIFRFLTKPCGPDELAAAVTAAQEHYRLINAERVLLQKTLAGSVKVLVDVLSLHDPDAFKDTTRLRAWAKVLAGKLKLSNAWTLNVTIMLSSLGRITLPNEVITKLRKGETLGEAEQDLVTRAPETARDLIANIPRLEPVAEAVYYQAAGFDGSGFPADGVSGDKLLQEARILRILADLAAASSADMPPASAFDQLDRNKQLYDPEILAAARDCLAAEPSEDGAADDEPEVLEVPIHLLRDCHKLHQNIETENDVILVSAGHRLNRVMIKKIQSYHKIRRLKEPIYVIEVQDDQPENAEQ